MLYFKILSKINQYENVITRIIYVVAYWTQIFELNELDRGQNETFFIFHTAAILLFCIAQRITIPKFCIFRKSFTIHCCMLPNQCSR